jgi:hypothetical protein
MVRRTATVMIEPPAQPEGIWMQTIGHRIVLGFGMDRNTTLDLLALALGHVAEVERHIAQQHEIIASLERNDLDASQIKVALVRIEEIHDMLIADRDRLERELAEMEPHSSASLPISRVVNPPTLRRS